MDIDKCSERYKEKLFKALEITKNLGCPPEKYRVKGHTNCFNCNECWRYALMNSMSIKSVNNII